MDPALLQSISGSSVPDQQNAIDQQLQDLILRRRMRQPNQGRTPGGALLGGLGDIIAGFRSRLAEGDLRQQRQDLSDKSAAQEQDYIKAILGTKEPVQAPPDMTAAPGFDQASQEKAQAQDRDQLLQAGALSGNPRISAYAKGYPAQAMEQENLAKAQEERTALASPQAGAAMRILLGKYGTRLPEGTPHATLRALLPTAEKGYAADQSKEARLEVAKIAAGARITTSGMGAGGAVDPKAIAQAIIEGKQPPDLTGMYRQGPAIRSELSRKGFDLSAAQQEWKATQKHLSSLNSTQQERLRQGIDFANHSLDVINGLYDDWKAIGAQTGVKLFNKVALAAAKQLPGDAGAAAQALDGQINDLTAELANVYMGGNSPTDHAIQLAAQNLQGNWNEETFKKAVGLIHTNLTLRRNAMLNSPTAGGSRYDKKPEASPTDAPKRKIYDQATGTLKDAP